MAQQIALPLIEISPDEVARKRTLGQAIELCAELAGYQDDNSQAIDLKIDKAQFSRIKSGQEGIKWERLQALMDAFGNDAPLLWMVQQRGYDLHSLRKVESELQRENRMLREENAALRRVVSAK